MKYTAESRGDPEAVDKPKQRLFDDEFEKIENTVIEINCILDNILEKIDPILMPDERDTQKSIDTAKTEYPPSPMRLKFGRVHTILDEVFFRLNRIENDIDLKND